MSKQVNTRVPEELYCRLKAMAKAMGLTVSALLRVAAVEYLDNHERSPNMRNMLVGWTVNGMSATVSLARPGQEPGNTANGVVLRITDIPDGITASEVVKAVEQTAIYLPRGPFEVPWDMLVLNKDGSAKIVTAGRLRERNAGGH